MKGRQKVTEIKTLYIVVPCYNEEDVLPETAKRLCKKLTTLAERGLIRHSSRVLFVDDGSRDSTWSIIETLHRQNPVFSGLKLSRNRGHQNALLAGLMTANDRADVIVSMDADLQDDIDAVDEMLKKYYDGCDIVYGVRSERKKDSFFKRSTAQLFYKLMYFLGAETVYNHADYRLMSKRAVEALSEFKEKNLFLRGIIPLIGFRSDIVYYERCRRFAGESKYPFKKMFAFAVEGITSFSVRPIRWISLIGFFIFLVSIVMIIIFIIQWALGMTISGWASVICSLWGIGGLIMLSLGMIGEYLGKLYFEVKQRPSYIVESLLDSSKEADGVMSGSV